MQICDDVNCYYCKQQVSIAISLIDLATCRPRRKVRRQLLLALERKRDRSASSESRSAKAIRARVLLKMEVERIGLSDLIHSLMKGPLFLPEGRMILEPGDLPVKIPIE
jgi:hypothetical protein